jgi:hypothetical protein
MTKADIITEQFCETSEIEDERAECLDRGTKDTSVFNSPYASPELK